MNRPPSIVKSPSKAGVSSVRQMYLNPLRYFTISLPVTIKAYPHHIHSPSPLRQKLDPTDQGRIETGMTVVQVEDTALPRFP